MLYQKKSDKSNKSETVFSFAGLTWDDDYQTVKSKLIKTGFLSKKDGSYFKEEDGISYLGGGMIIDDSTAREFYNFYFETYDEIPDPYPFLKEKR